MSNEDKHLVQALREVPVRPDGTRVFSPELRRRAVAGYRAKRAQGVICRMIGDTLGIHPVLLASWARREQTQGFRQIALLSGAEPSALKPVAQVDASARQQTPHAAQDFTPKAGLTLIRPRGRWLECPQPSWLPQLIDELHLFDQLYAATSPLVHTWAALHAHLLRQEQLFGDETP